MWFKITSYIRFLIKSTNQHGVHSPFVFNLITRCFYKKTPNKLKDKYLAYRKFLKTNQNSLIINDLGEGSKVFKTNKRQINKIAKVAGISNKRAFLLIRLTSYFNPNLILELGTSLGLSTIAMHLGNSKANFITVEGCKNTANFATSSFQKFDFQNITVRNANFNNILPELTNNNTFDFIYIDGNHQKQATINYFNQCLTAIHNNSVLIFDDIYWSKQMQEAWQYIKNHPQVQVTIDTFTWGFVFFRKEQVKQHFTIRL